MININIRLKLNNQVQLLVDRIHGKPADIIMTFNYSIIILGIIFSFFNIIKMTKYPIMDNINPDVLTILLLISLFSLFFSQLGDYYKKPSRKIWQYVLIIFGISIFSLNYLAITFNTLFVQVLNKIHNIEIIPPDLLIGNIRVVTTLLPIAIILPVLYISLDTLRDKKSKDMIREYELDVLLPTVHKQDDSTIDIEICKDYKTGLPCIVPEKIWYEHTWCQGGSGSGKTSSFLLPLEEQLLRKKSYLNYKLKEIAVDCLKNGIATINRPISNKWFNENFDLSLIEPINGKENEFYEAFKKYTLGTIKKNELTYEETFSNSSSFILDGLRSKDYSYEGKVSIYKNNMIYDEVNFIIEKNNEVLLIDMPTLMIESNLMLADEANVNYSEDGLDVNYVIKEGINNIKVNISGKALSNKSTDQHTSNREINDEYSYSVKVFSKGNGRLVPKNLGMTVIAPDGELVNTTVKLGADYGVKVHKIDPYKDEIRKGNVAKFNPLKGDSPEKIGDIVASILVSMDAGSSANTNPYFTNASVRAVRNLVILLKISFPHTKHREPTLEDVLFCLNNFNEVTESVKYVKNNYALLKQWRSVIDYFETSFMDTPIDPNESKAASTNIGTQKKETQRAISGIINQLDNLLGREEIRYILCSEEDSLDLSEVLKKGECIAISTRQGNLGARLGRAFALFFILSLQNEVLSRYGENENPEIPHHLIIDEFPMYCNENTETFFSFARKYKCAVTIAIQDMAQLKKVSNEFGETIFTNTTTKLLLPKANLEDRKYWSDFFGTTNEMELMTGVTTSSIFADAPSYSESLRGTMADTKNVTEEQVDNLNFQELFYSYTNKKGRKSVGKGTTEFMKSNPEPYMQKIFDFEPYSITDKKYKEMQSQVVKVESQKENNEELNKISKTAKLNSKMFSVNKEEVVEVKEIKEPILNVINESKITDNPEIEVPIFNVTNESIKTDSPEIEVPIFNVTNESIKTDSPEIEVIEVEQPTIIVEKEKPLVPSFIIKQKPTNVNFKNNINLDELLLVNPDINANNQPKEINEIEPVKKTVYTLFDN